MAQWLEERPSHLVLINLVRLFHDGRKNKTGKTRTIYKEKKKKKRRKEQKIIKEIKRGWRGLGEVKE